MDLKILDYAYRWKKRKRYGREEYLPASTKPLEHALGVVKTARRDGEMNLPPASATALIAFEMRIIETHVNLQREDTESYQRGYSRYKGLISEADAARQADHFSNLIAWAKRQCEDALRNAGDDIRQSWKKVASAQAEMTHFREVNGLRYEPVRYDKRLNKIAVLGALTIGEGILNAQMFAAASREGMLGGFKEAFIISLTSVLVSAASGYLMRFGNARRYTLRRIGMAVRLGWGPFIASFHLTVGHYRDALVAKAPHPAAAAIEAMRTAPFDLDEFHSVILCILGLMAAAWACVEGYCLDCSYPQYGEKARAVDRARDAHADLKYDLFDAFAGIVEEGRDKVRQSALDAGDALADYENALRDAVDYLLHYANMSEYIRQSCIRLVRLYRETNVLERSERPPAYFSADIDPPFGMDPALAHDLEQAQSLLSDIRITESLRALHAGVMEAEAELDALENEFRAKTQNLFDLVEGRPPDPGLDKEVI
jgi:hypothetical protein